MKLSLLGPKLFPAPLVGLLLRRFSAMSIGVRCVMVTGGATPCELLAVTVSRYSRPGLRPVTVNRGDHWFSSEATKWLSVPSWTYNRNKCNISLEFHNIRNCERKI